MLHGVIYHSRTLTPASGDEKAVCGKIREYQYVFQCVFCGKIFKSYSECFLHQKGELKNENLSNSSSETIRDL